MLFKLAENELRADFHPDKREAARVVLAKLAYAKKLTFRDETSLRMAITELSIWDDPFLDSIRLGGASPWVK